MKVILMHGKDATPVDKWYPWFKNACEEEGWESVVPILPNPAEPVLDEWVSELDNFNPDNDTVLVGHSRGGVAVLRYLEQAPKDLQVKAVVLVAANDGRRSHIAIPTETNYGFYTEEGYDFENIKTHCDNFFVLHSKDDHVVPYEAGAENAKALNAKLVTFEDKRHFGTQPDGMSMSEFTELIEIVKSL